MVDGKSQDREFLQYLGHYEVLEELGEGGIGEVYVARPTRGEHAGTLVCLKVMSRARQAAKDSRRQAAIDSLRREARVVSQLRHPNIAMLLDSGAYNDVWFLAFELVKGATLAEILELQPAGVGLAPEHVRRIGIEVAAALQCAHEHDVLHRDIKPQNILVSTSGQVKVVDFGVAKMNARDAADFTVGVGTPRYWAPEQVREESISPQTDIFALGIVLYELLTTSHPFHDDNPNEHRKNVLRGALASPLRETGLPADLVSIVECCLQGDPANRFQSAQALQTALRSGGKAAAFEFDIGVIATAAREAAVEERLMLKDGVAPEPGNDEKTALPDMHLHETRHASPQELAETVKDSIPGALTRHVRDEVVHDLSKLAQHAYQQRQTHIGRQRETTRMEGWQHPGISGVRPSEPATALEIRPPRDRQITKMERADAPIPDPPVETRAASGTPPIAHDENATNVVPGKRAGRWPLAIAALAAAAVAAIFASSPGTPGRDEQERQTRSDTSTRAAASSGDSRAAQSPAQAPARPAAVAAEALEPARPETAAPPGLAALQHSAADQPAPTTTAPERDDQPEPAAQNDAPNEVTSSSANRPRKADRAEPRDLVEVTIGIIPFGNVTVDGKPVGPAPAVVKLAPGRHRIVGRSRELRRVQSIVVTTETSHIVLDLRDDEASR